MPLFLAMKNAIAITTMMAIIAASHYDGDNRSQPEGAATRFIPSRFDIRAIVIVTRGYAGIFVIASRGYAGVIIISAGLIGNISDVSAAVVAFGIVFVVEHMANRSACGGTVAVADTVDR